MGSSGRISDKVSVVSICAKKASDFASREKVVPFAGWILGHSMAEQDARKKSRSQGRTLPQRERGEKGRWKRTRSTRRIETSLARMAVECVCFPYQDSGNP